MEIKPIETKNEYKLALKRVDGLFAQEVKKGSTLGNELEVLLILIDKYEDEHFKIAKPDPVEAIKFRTEQISCV